MVSLGHNELTNVLPWYSERSFQPFWTKSSNKKWKCHKFFLQIINKYVLSNKRWKCYKSCCKQSTNNMVIKGKRRKTVLITSNIYQTLKNVNSVTKIKLLCGTFKLSIFQTSISTMTAHNLNVCLDQYEQTSTVGFITCRWPFLLIWFRFNPHMDK